MSGQTPVNPVPYPQSGPVPAPGYPGSPYPPVPGYPAAVGTQPGVPGTQGIGGPPSGPMPVPPMAPAQAAQPPAYPTGGMPTGKKLIHEKTAPSIPGLLGMLIVLALGLYALYLLYQGIIGSESLLGTVNGAQVILGLILLVVAFLCQSAFTVVQPGTTKVLQFLGNYVGTIRATGLRMTYPFTTKRQVSVKVRNFETREIKVNDSQGNPVIIAAIIVWQVQDTAQSVFQVEYYEQFVQVQSEAALRHIATIHPYDNGEEGESTLRGATDQVAAELAHEVGERVSIAGVTIIETRISSLSYAPEIASAMLQRQQAQAVLAARAKIVEGAVTMVESALDRIEKENIVNMDDDRKAAMVSNLLVVLCSDSRALPTLNTGLS